MPVYAFSPQQDNRLSPGEAATNLASTLGNIYGKYQDDKIIGELQKNPNISPISQLSLIGKLSKDKQSSLMKAFEIAAKYKQRDDKDAARAQKYLEEQEYKTNREKRLSSKDLQSAYHTRIKQLNSDFKDSYDPKEKNLLKDARDNLTKELSTNQARMRKGQAPVFEFLEYGAEQPVQAQAAPVEGMNQMGGMQGQGRTPTIFPQGTVSMRAPQVQAQVKQKVRWDPRNPEHQALAAKVFEETGGDRVATNRILAEEFEK